MDGTNRLITGSWDRYDYNRDVVDALQAACVIGSRLKRLLGVCVVRVVRAFVLYRTIKIWDHVNHETKQAKCVATLSGHEFEVKCIARHGSMLVCTLFKIVLL